MNVKLVSDGTKYGTKITDLETGKVLEDVTRFNIDINSNNSRPVTAIIEREIYPIQEDALSIECKADTVWVLPHLGMKIYDLEKSVNIQVPGHSFCFDKEES